MKVKKAEEMKAMRFANPHFSNGLLLPISASDNHMKNPGMAIRSRSETKIEIRARLTPKKVRELKKDSSILSTAYELGISCQISSELFLRGLPSFSSLSQLLLVKLHVKPSR